MHDVEADHVRADQIVPTKDEQKLGTCCLFANARWRWRDRGPKAAICVPRPAV